MRPTPLRFAQRGLSMVELMVAMAIALIGTIIIFQVFEASEGVKRTSTSGGDAQQNGAIALYSLEHDLRNAGMGFNDTFQAGCNMIGYDNQRVPPDFPVAGVTLQMVPVRIIPGTAIPGLTAAQNPDALAVMYGSQTRIASATTLTFPFTAATGAVQVNNIYAFRPGDLIVLRERNTVAVPSTKACSILEVTGIDPATPDSLLTANGNYTLPNGATVTARFNKPGGMGVNYVARSTNVYNLGNLYDTNGMTMPVSTTYYIQNNSLTTSQVFVVSPPTQVADNIVHMRVLYGLDDGGPNNNTVPYQTVYAAGDGMVDRYVDGSTVPDWRYVIQVRIVLVARSALPEIPAAGRGAPCDTTTVEPTWSGSQWSGTPWNFNTRLDLSADPNWKCYRYKTFETTVALRNWVWSNSTN